MFWSSQIQYLNKSTKFNFITNVSSSHHLYWTLIIPRRTHESWWRNQMEGFFALVALFAWNSPVTGEFPSQRASNAKFEFFYLDPHKLLNKQSFHRWFGTTWLSCDVIVMSTHVSSGPNDIILNSSKTMKGIQMMCILHHYSDVIMGAIASQIPGVSIVCSNVCSGADQRKHQSSVSLVSVRGIHR